MKLGLVLEGGASRTYFSVGVMDALMDENIWADYCIGASAGIANGISYMSRQRGRSIEIGRKYLHDKRYMGWRHFINPKNKSYYNIPFVFEEMPRDHVPFDYETFEKNCAETYAAVTNIATGASEYIPLTAEDKTWKALVASCALPGLFPPILLNKALYMDGGIADPIPVLQAIKDGCDRVIVVLTREREYVKTKESGLGIASFLFRKYPAFVETLSARTARYNETVQQLFELEKEGRALVLAPKNTAGWHRTESAPEKIQKMYDEGILCVKNRREEILSFIK
ncbi:MAG: patatin family protein [Clostridia bacterium]|nr:patatin family protein [Clostridia bacterium]